MLPIANLGLRLTAQVTFTDDQWSVYCPELDLAAASETSDSAIYELAQLAIEYAAEYLADFDLYVNSANRSGHLPYILAIARHTTDPDDAEALEAVRQLFAIRQGWAD
jgi:alkanesulfonate monooxygenase SsuD/methylene tetrahydromethanopterin reductase-like flavin-dependent oxidoreductase (luciferase family)